MRFVLQQDGTYLDTQSADNSKITLKQLQKLREDHKRHRDSLGNEDVLFEKMDNFVKDLEESLEE